MFLVAMWEFNKHRNFNYLKSVLRDKKIGENMSKSIKRLLLGVAMVACMFGLSSTEQQANTKNIINGNSLSTINNNIEEPTALYQVGVEILCDEIEIFEIPPIFGFGGATVGFGTGCGENSDQDCVASAILLGGKLVVHVECTDSQ